MGWIAGLAALAGAATEAYGSNSQNAANKREGQKNRDFQERMSSTAYQRAVQDMQKAGINPILAGTKATGASTPSGSMPHMENPLRNVAATALQASRMSAELDNIKADTEKKKSEKNLTDKNVQLRSAPSEVMQDASDLYSTSKQMLKDEKFQQYVGEKIKDTISNSAKTVGDKVKQITQDVQEFVNELIDDKKPKGEEPLRTKNIKRKYKSKGK